MKTYQLEFSQNLPIPLTEAWAFFSSPFNLSRITPQEMGFEITSNTRQDAKMYAGMIITYKVSPFTGVKLDWVTEITHVRENRYFVDEQRFGPYRFWHHEHHFKEIESGVQMQDILTYGMPYGILGRGVNRLLVAKKLQHIFHFRKEKILNLFGDYRAVGT
jgi:ligand-binding SRPBCC domain-containing protein